MDEKNIEKIRFDKAYYEELYHNIRDGNKDFKKKR